MTGVTWVLRQSWRDLWRNRRRTLLVALSMFVSSLMMFAMIGLTAGMTRRIAETVTGSYVGHFQVQHREFADRPSLDYRVDKVPTEALTRLLAEDEEVAGVSPRVTAGGLMTRKIPDPPDEEDLSAYRRMSSEAVLLMGVDPRTETGVSRFAENVLVDDPAARCVRGCQAGLAEVGKPGNGCGDGCDGAAAGWLGDACGSRCDRVCTGVCDEDDPFCDEDDCRERCTDYCEPARFLASEDPFAGRPYRSEVVLGQDLARVAKVSVGDRVAITTGTALGRSYGAIYRVAGLVHMPSPQLDRTLALTHRATLAAGMEMPGCSTELVVRLHEFEASVPLAERVGEELGRIEGGAELAALPWTVLAPDVDTCVTMKMGGTYVMVIMFTIIIGVIVANVVTMAVLERTREYGMRMAVGEGPGRIVASLLLEAALLALLASLSGILVAAGALAWWSVHGIDFGMGTMQTAGVAMEAIMYPTLEPFGGLFAVVTVVFFSLVGASWPAFRIRRLRPVDALKFQ
jgi:ABC-type lipoprotein release transport system permease subunit